MFGKKEVIVIDEVKEKAIQEMMIVTTNNISGKEIKEVLGLVQIVQLPERQCSSEIQSFSDKGFYHLSEKAYEIGANAIIGVRTGCFGNFSEVVSYVVFYGTAVKI